MTIKIGILNLNYNEYLNNKNHEVVIKNYLAKIDENIQYLSKTILKELDLIEFELINMCNDSVNIVFIIGGVFLDETVSKVIKHTCDIVLPGFGELLRMSLRQYPEILFCKQNAGIRANTLIISLHDNYLEQGLKEIFEPIKYFLDLNAK